VPSDALRRSGSPSRSLDPFFAPVFHSPGSDFVSLGVLSVCDIVSTLSVVLAVALHGGMSSNISKNLNFYIRHPIGYLTEREVYFPAPSKWVHIIEWFR
jgi:hypothetical protein